MNNIFANLVNPVVPAITGRITIHLIGDGAAVNKIIDSDSKVCYNKACNTLKLNHQGEKIMETNTINSLDTALAQATAKVAPKAETAKVRAEAKKPSKPVITGEAEKAKAAKAKEAEKAAKAKEAEKAKAAKAKEKAAKAKEAEKAKAAKAKEKAAADALKAKERAAKAKEAEKAKAAKAANPKANDGKMVPADLSKYHKNTEVKTAGGNASVDVDDEVAHLLRGKTLEQLYTTASGKLGVPVNDLRSKYGHLNVGMQRMNIGNRIRKVMKADHGAA